MEQLLSHQPYTVWPLCVSDAYVWKQWCNCLLTCLPSFVTVWPAVRGKSSRVTLTRELHMTLTYCLFKCSLSTSQMCLAWLNGNPFLTQRSDPLLSKQMSLNGWPVWLSLGAVPARWRCPGYHIWFQHLICSSLKCVDLYCTSLKWCENVCRNDFS